MILLTHISKELRQKVRHRMQRLISNMSATLCLQNVEFSWNKIVNNSSIRPNLESMMSRSHTPNKDIESKMVAIDVGHDLSTSDYPMTHLVNTRRVSQSSRREGSILPSSFFSPPPHSLDYLLPSIFSSLHITGRDHTEIRG